MARGRVGVLKAVARYRRELERRGIPVERLILFGSYGRRRAASDSDIDVAVFSPAFGSPAYIELSGILSEAAWSVEPAIQAIGFHPSALVDASAASFVHEIASTGEEVTSS